MATNVIMPQMGESVAEGTITVWLKQVGDAVDRDEPIFEITTDKVDAEIPSPEAGILLAIKVQAGETVEVGSVVAIIGAAGEVAGESSGANDGANDADDAPVKAAAAAPAAAAAAAVSDDRPQAEMTAAELRQRRSTPVVRKIATEHDVDIADVDGTGLDGRVTKKDILAFIEAGGAKKAAAVPAPQAPRPSAPVAQSQPASSGKVSMGIPMIPVTMRDADSHERMSPMRRSISDHMIKSKTYSAHVHSCFEIDYGTVNALRKKFKPKYAERGGRLTFTTFLAKAVIKALQAFPIVNASHDGENVIYRGDINLGIAVAVDWGLLVPVIKQADEISMLGLSKRIADVGERARTKKLKTADLADLTFSITNPGTFGSQWGTPIIPQPSVAIMGVGMIEKRVKVHTLPDGSDTMVIKLCGYLTLGFDHRVIDGAVADQFMSHVKNTLESFDESAM